MCPIGIVLTDSPYVPATDTLTEKRCKSTKKGENSVPPKWKNSATQAFAQIADFPDVSFFCKYVEKHLVQAPL
jgi:hypothetical protein